MVRPASRWAPRPRSGVAGFPWNQWQHSCGTGGSFRVELVARFTWNRWQLSRGIRSRTNICEKVDIYATLIVMTPLIAAHSHKLSR